MTMRRAGFSLIEVMVAIAVLSIGLLGLISVSVSGDTLSRDSTDTVIAAQDLNSAVEMIRGAPYTSLFGNSSLFLNANGSSMGTEVAQYHNYHLLDEKISATFVNLNPNTGAETGTFTTVPAVIPQMIEIQLTITWSQASSVAASSNSGTNPFVNQRLGGTNVAPALRTACIIRTQAD
ncbi:MAG TPA: prepilin-type N-terminal cleavage/methylation domain-containing protein [Planctomycetota bacterium]|nr:prepilin-type N-terminal cleavage/methylation domain-containing protein [Planctomycetota bacterium]